MISVGPHFSFFYAFTFLARAGFPFSIFAPRPRSPLPSALLVVVLRTACGSPSAARRGGLCRVACDCVRCVRVRALPLRAGSLACSMLEMLKMLITLNYSYQKWITP